MYAYPLKRSLLFLINGMAVSYVGMCMLSHTYTASKVLNDPVAGDDRRL